MSELRNSYPELPQLPYQRTSADMNEVIAYIKSLEVSKEVKIAIYVMFRMESGNGKSGINNNYGGIQADSGRWPPELEKQMTGTVVKTENGTGKVRRFIAFKNVTGSLDFLANRVQKRGLYVGGTSTKITTMKINTPKQWCDAYNKSWVTGNPHAVIPAAKQKTLLSMYSQGETIFHK